MILAAFKQLNARTERSKSSSGVLSTLRNCNTCSSTLHVTEEDEMTSNTSCLGYRCSGHYEKSESEKLNYYNLVYNRTKSPRIYAAEHTGVLERKDRENTEYDFKERPKYNSLNTLVATSTLEMGIDVGSLNTAINTSVCTFLCK